MNKITYSKWVVAIQAGEVDLKVFEIVACDSQAAIADVKATYGEDVEIAFLYYAGQ